MRIGRFDLLRLDAVTSTQDEARSRAREGCRSGTVILAEEQTAGRGRGDRTWESRSGLGLWLTAVHRTARGTEEWPGATAVACLSLCLAMEDLHLVPQAKWPNDVCLSGRKVAGVLADCEADAILLGIGVNVLHDEQDFSTALRGHATSLSIEAARIGRPPPDRELFLRALLSRLAAALESFEAAGSSEAVQGIWDRSALHDRTVTVETPSRERISGIAAGLGPVGQLLLKTPQGVHSIAGGSLVDSGGGA